MKVHIKLGIGPRVGVLIKAVVNGLALAYDLFDSPHLPRFKPDLDPVRVLR